MVKLTIKLQKNIIFNLRERERERIAYFVKLNYIIKKLYNHVKYNVCRQYDTFPIVNVQGRNT